MAGNHSVRTTMIAAAAMLAAACSPTPTNDPAMPRWMAGTWRQGGGESAGPDGGGAWTEEFWTKPRAGQMMGSGRSGRGAALDSWEHMRIVRGPKGAVSFFAMPQGAQASAFPMVARTSTSIEFANPAHDYPQRIRYWREGAKLHAEIARIDGSKAMRWTFARVVR